MMTDAALVEAVARRVVELLRDEGLAAPPEPRLLDAAEVATRFGVSAEWVRDHADDLGAVRLGDGPRPRLRFDPDAVRKALSARSGSGRSEDQRLGSTAGPRPIRASAGSGEPSGQLPRRSVDVKELPNRTGRRRANGPPQATRKEPSSRSQRSPQPRETTAADRAPSADADDGRTRDGA